ncbi:AAA family ATPase [Actinomyces capricornis]|uniref:Chromosome segregation protein SMC n=1 Tax=Actinomyces capricornis TaxID=2755559 RepID=A0ABN6K867_9ACTO|nr:AAA family ATPase [Actinomyces capricornis]BDA64254.1 chromosome segregation protein SMC [Actinomyces capricornis]
MSSTALGRLVVTGLKSMRSVALEPTTGVTVLIGANGAGKSNLVGALELISRIWDDSFQEYVAAQGGMSALVFEDSSGTAELTRIEVYSSPDAEDCLGGYRVDLRADDDDAAVLSESMLFHNRRRYPDRPYDKQLGSSRSSRARRIAEESTDPKLVAFANHITPLLAGCRVFHFDDVSPNAPVKGWSTVGDDVSLRMDAENIAAYLLRVRQEHPRHYQRIVSAIRHVTPFFDDFVLVPNQAGRIRLRWRQRGLDRTFLAREASDGTLRFMCLATLLLGPDLPATVVLDEPELGLHPSAIALLAEMARMAGDRGHRVILATQSVPLLSHFSLEEVAVLDRADGATTVIRPDSKQLSGFLEEFSVGTMWEMNLLGGRPSHSEGDR